MLVRVLQSAGRLQDAIQRLVQRQGTALRDQQRQVGAIDVLHHEEVRAARFVGVVGNHDVGVCQPGSGLDLPLESAQSLRRLHDLGRQDLQGDQPFHPPVLGLEHQSHAALAELVEDDVVAQHQRATLAAVELLDLVGGELLLADQFPDKLFAILGFLVGGQAVDQRRDFVGRHQSAVDKLRTNCPTGVASSAGRAARGGSPPPFPDDNIASAAVAVARPVAASGHDRRRRLPGRRPSPGAGPATPGDRARSRPPGPPNSR